MFEDLSVAKTIALDIETYDPQLKEKGCGAFREGSYILGVSLATDDGLRKYYPLNHVDQHNNLDEQKVYAYLNAQLANPKQKVIGANLLYDLEFLASRGVSVKSKLIDVLIAEPLIDENQFKYSLDTVAQKYLNETKKTDLLYQRAEQLNITVKKGTDIRAYLYLFPSSDVADYAIADVDLPLRVFEEQKKILRAEELERVFDIELRLLPLLLQMKLTGCRIDVAKATRLMDELTHRKAKLKTQLNNLGIDPASSDEGRKSIANYLINKGVELPRTPKTQKPMLNMDLLKTLGGDCDLIVEYRQLEKFIGTFLESQILGSLRGDRIHAQFNQLRDTEGGTVTGRFSSSRPNLQNIPARNKELGPLCRELFLPEEGHLYGSADYSQIEFRIACHFGMGAGANEIRQAYVQNPAIDIHQWCAEAAGISRNQAKTINFAVIYGQGIAKTGKALDLTLEEAKEFIEVFNQKMPFIKQTSKEAMKRAQYRGWVKTILGRKRRFNLYESAAYGARQEDWKPFTREEAEVQWGTNIKRSMTHKSFNAIVQGSSADLMKLAMVTAYERGLFNTATLLTTVHDELNVSVPNNTEGQEAFKEMVNIMQTCYPFKVPILVDSGLGNNWAEAKG